MKKPQGSRCYKNNSSPALIPTCPKDIDCIVGGPAANHKRIRNDFKEDKIGVNVTGQGQDWEGKRSGLMPKYPGLEHWMLVEKIGDGVSSNVYRAKDNSGVVGDVAIKVIHKLFGGTGQDNRAQDPSSEEVPDGLNNGEMLDEVRIMRGLNHPNIVKLVDFIESPKFYFIILELCPGGELFHQIARLTYFSEELSRHVIHQVAKAVEFLHEHAGIAHRDIKPENLLFYPIEPLPNGHPYHGRVGDEDKVDEGKFIYGVGGGGIGKVKLADFGLSKVMGNTGTTTPCGTIGYTAPEIVKDERYSKSVDMWSIGCILYTLLCGFGPFDDDSISAVTQKVARGEYTFLEPWWDDVSGLARDLISRLLTVDPKKRYTIRQFLEHPWITQKNITVPPAMVALRVMPSAENPSHGILRGARAPDSLLSSKAVDAKHRPRYHPYCMLTARFGRLAAQTMQIEPHISAAAHHGNSMDAAYYSRKQEKTKGMSAPNPRPCPTLVNFEGSLNKSVKGMLGPNAPRTDRSTSNHDPPRDLSWYKPAVSPWPKISNTGHHSNSTFQLNLGHATLLKRRAKKQHKTTLERDKIN